MTELYKKYRPKKLDELVGQSNIIRTIKGWGKPNQIPHALLLTGQSGCGKTTLARIIRRMLRCSKGDFSELNTADFRGIDMVRDVRSRVMLSPLGGGDSRVWLIDECHKLSVDAQEAMLKLLEDTPSHVWFILATTEPNKLKVTIRNRCTTLELKPLRDDDMAKLLDGICVKENIELTDDVGDKIVEVAEGSPRKALVLLDQVAGIEDEEDQLKAIATTESQREAIDLARLLMKMKPTARWSEVSKLLNSIEGLEGQAEGIRRMLLAYHTKVMLGGGEKAGRAFDIVNVMRDNFYDSGKAGLVASLYEIVGQ